MFDCVARWKSAYIRPERVEICRPVQFLRYATNYGGVLRKSDQLRKRVSYQLFATILIDVCYKVYGSVAEAGDSPNHTNHLHALQDVFHRRLNQGRLYQTPCLGWSEFTPSYFGPLRDATRPCEDINDRVPSMLTRVFNSDTEGLFAPVYKDVIIDKGVLSFAE